MRCEIGWPMEIAAGICASRLRMSACTSAMLRFSSAAGNRPTSSSLTCTPSACSSSSARPLRRPTCVTSGTWRTSTSAWRASALDSASVTPGLSRMPMSSVPSLNGGKNVVGKNGTAAADSATATALTARAVRGRASTATSPLR
ncbi:hypothetical protein D3C71_1345960 [compost metagenome]